MPKSVTVNAHQNDRPWFDAVKCLARQRTAQDAMTSTAQRTFLTMYVTLTEQATRTGKDMGIGSQGGALLPKADLQLCLSLVTYTK